jgi:hypothetical protein
VWLHAVEEDVGADEAAAEVTKRNQEGHAYCAFGGGCEVVGWVWLVDRLVFFGFFNVVVVINREDWAREKVAWRDGDLPN